MIEEIPLGTTSPGMPRAEYHGELRFARAGSAQYSLVFSPSVIILQAR